MPDTLLGDLARGALNCYPPCCVLAYCWQRYVRGVEPAISLGIRATGTPRAHVPCGVLHVPDSLWSGRSFVDVAP